MSLINTRDPEQILGDLVATFQASQPDINLNEASTIYIMFQIYAFVSALNVATMQNFALSAFIATSEGDNLTALADDRGVTRILATQAIVPLTFSRLIVDNVSAHTIPASSLVSTTPDENGNYYTYATFDTLTLPASTLSVTGLSQAVSGGSVYNVAANSVNNFLQTISGIDTVNNLDAGYGGTDEETDEELRARIKVVLASNSAKGTVAGYQNTLLALGALSAYVYSPSGTMPNYITAIVTSDSTSNTVPTSAELSYWTTQINLDENRAVADVITVAAPSTVTITVSAKITEFEAGADSATTIAGVKTAIIDYINSLPPNNNVYRNNIGNIAHDYSGVKDYTLYLPTGNTNITNIQKAIADTSSVTIT